MDIPREVREELNTLCKEVFGVSSKWQRFVKGVSELVTKTVTEEVPGDKDAPATTREVQIPVLLDGAKQYKTKFYTTDEVRELLLKYKEQKDAIMAQIKTAEEEKKAKAQLEQAQKEVQNLAAGQSTT